MVTPEKRVEALATEFLSLIPKPLHPQASTILGSLFSEARGRTDYQNTKLLKHFLMKLVEKVTQPAIDDGGSRIVGYRTTAPYGREPTFITCIMCTAPYDTRELEPISRTEADEYWDRCMICKGDL